VSHAPVIAIKPPWCLHNCFRCGLEFDASDGSRICLGCRAPKPTPVLNPNLSFREKQVVKLVTQAKLNKEIAFELHLTEGTVKEYLNRIFKKLGVSNRVALAVWAVTHCESVTPDGGEASVFRAGVIVTPRDR
jgi:DNA-binding CsgD family transcriptional regulator